MSILVIRSQENSWMDSEGVLGIVQTLLWAILAGDKWHLWVGSQPQVAAERKTLRATVEKGNNSGFKYEPPKTGVDLQSGCFSCGLSHRWAVVGISICKDSIWFLQAILECPASIWQYNILTFFKKIVYIISKMV